jgi:acyl-CoA thioester hydrolase
MKARHFFKNAATLPDGASAPAPLAFSVCRTSRFSEVDALGIVWHGHYAEYFEDARVAFGNHYGLSYKKMHNAGVTAPIKQMFIDYDLPLQFDNEFEITATLFWNDAARLNFEYKITSNDGILHAHGYTVQLFLKRDGELLYAKPDFYENFCLRWKNNLLVKPEEQHHAK